MPDEAWMIPLALALLATAGLVPLVGRFGRQPCPHCGRKAGRSIVEVHSLPGGLGARTITYACRACGGAMRYARRPTGQEFWEPITRPEGEAS